MGLIITTIIVWTILFVVFIKLLKIKPNKECLIISEEIKQIWKIKFETIIDCYQIKAIKLNIKELEFMKFMSILLSDPIQNLTPNQVKYLNRIYEKCY